MPILKWAANLSGATEREREQMQDVFDTKFWTMNVNRQLLPDTEIMLSPVGSKGNNKGDRFAFAHCQNGKWTAELK
jgi:hypothetical protein